MKKLLLMLMLLSSPSFAVTELGPQDASEKLFAAVNSGKVVVVKFYAKWCGACKRIAPMYEEAEKKLSGKAEFFAVDVDTNNALARQVDALPTIIVVKTNGQNVIPIVGVPNSQEDLESQIQERMK